jgi:hypothetical protein
MATNGVQLASAMVLTAGGHEPAVGWWYVGELKCFGVNSIGWWLLHSV